MEETKTENFIRVTQWIRPKSSIKSGLWGPVSGQAWCHLEADDMENRTGNTCQVHVREDVNPDKNGMLAIFRDM